MLHLLNKQTAAILLCETNYLGIDHLHDGVILLPRPDTKTRMLCQNAFSFKFVFHLGNKGTIGKISLTIKTTEQHFVLGSKMTPSFK